MVKRILPIVVVLLIVVAAAMHGNAATTLLPNGEQCFQTSAGPVSNGSLNMYYPNTTNPKTTWTNSSQTSANTAPVQLDQNGCAILYGVGSYRQQLWTGPVVGGSTTGTLVFDLITTDTSAYNSTFWAGLAGGTPNAVVVQDPGFNATDGTVINFIPLYTNSSSVTLQTATGGTAYSIVKDTGTGAVALTGGELVANSPSNVVSAIFSATQQNFHILNLVNTAIPTIPLAAPGGYLNLVGVAAGGPIQGSGDVTAATKVYYSPYRGNQIPFWNGSSFTVLAFPELSLNLSASAQSASTIYDVFVFNNNGSPVAVFGPAWSTSTAGSGARGTGAGTTQLTYVSGILVNAVQISANNGTNTYTIPANEATYVGSVFVDATAGQVSNYRTWGGGASGGSGGTPRKWAVWNAYNRQPICMLVGDASATWLGTGSIEAANGNTNNSLSVFTGLAEEEADNSINQKVLAVNVIASVGIGVNVTNAFSGQEGIAISPDTSTSFTVTASADYILPPTLGVTTITALNDGSSGNAIFYGTQANMQMKSCYRG